MCVKKKRFVRTMSELYKRLKQCDFGHGIVTAFNVYIRYFRRVRRAYSYVEVFLSSRLELFFDYPRVCVVKTCWNFSRQSRRKHEAQLLQYAMVNRD